MKTTRISRRPRAVVMISAFLIVVVLLMMILGMIQRLHGSSFINRGSQEDHLAWLGAQSGLAETLANLTIDNNFHGNITGKTPDGLASYSVHFGSDESVNNLMGSAAADCPLGAATLAPQSAYIEIHGSSGLRERVVKVIVGRVSLISPTGDGVLASHDIYAVGNFTVNGSKSFVDTTKVDANIQSLDPGGHYTVNWDNSQGGHAIINGTAKASSPFPTAINVTTGQVQASQVNAASPRVPAVNIDYYIAGAANCGNTITTVPGSTSFSSGNYYMDGDLNYDGAVNLSGANLFVTGNVNVTGSVSGKGAILCAKSTTISGNANLSTDLSQNIAIYSKGNIVLQGFDGAQWLKDRATDAGNDPNGVPYLTHINNLQDAMTRQKADLQAHLQGSDSSNDLFGKDQSDFDRIGFSLGHTPQATSWVTSLPFTNDPNQTNPLGRLTELVQNQPPSASRSFMLDKLHALFDGSSGQEHGLYAAIPQPARNTCVTDAISTGNPDGLADAVNDADTNVMANFGNANWSTYSPAQISQVYNLLYNQVDQVSFENLGKANFKGILYTNGAFVSLHDVKVIGSILAIDNGTQQASMINGTMRTPGAVYLSRESAIQYIAGLESSAGQSLGILGVVTWLTP